MEKRKLTGDRITSVVKHQRRNRWCLCGLHWHTSGRFCDVILYPQNKTGKEPVHAQLWRRKCKWIGHTLRRSDDSVDKQATSQDHRGRGRPRNTWRRDLKKEMWTAGFKYSCRKMEVVTQDTAQRQSLVRLVHSVCGIGVTIFSSLRVKIGYWNKLSMNGHY